MTEKFINIEKSFELPTDIDWNYLENKFINGMRIDANIFQGCKSNILMYPRIEECIFGLNNKIDSLCITYVMCKHYFDLGIPDEPWYVSPSLDGKKSVQYMPNFKSEHHMRLFWFNHFAASLYVTAFGVWDSIIEIINIFYDINAKPDFRQRSEILKWLKTNQNDIFTIFDELKDNKKYLEANEYRTQFVHGIAPSEISNQYTYKKHTEMQIIDSEASKKEGKAVFKTVQHATILSGGVGEYTPVKDVIETFEKFAELTATKKDELIILMKSDEQSRSISLWHN